MQFDNIITHTQYATPYELATQAVRAGDRVLDWGCGNGHFSLFLELLGAQVTGFSFDPRPPAMASSRTFTFVHGSEADPRRLPFADDSFDVAVSVGVLEHVCETGGDELSSLTELRRVIRPGGALLVFHLPNRGGWTERAAHALNPRAYIHPRRFDAELITSLWTRAGLSIVDMGLYNALPRGQLARLPARLRHSRRFAAVYDAVDQQIGRRFPRICTNFFVVARKVI